MYIITSFNTFDFFSGTFIYNGAFIWFPNFNFFFKFLFHYSAFLKIGGRARNRTSTKIPPACFTSTGLQPACGNSPIFFGTDVTSRTLSHKVWSLAQVPLKWRRTGTWFGGRRRNRTPTCYRPQGFKPCLCPCTAPSKNLERIFGFEPNLPDWQSNVLPSNTIPAK